MSLRIEGKRQPLVAGIGEVPFVPTVEQGDESARTARDGQDEGALAAEGDLGPFALTGITQFRPGPENRVGGGEAAGVEGCGPRWSSGMMPW